MTATPTICLKDRLRDRPRPQSDELQRGISFLADCQGADGSWKGDYGGSYFLTPMWAAALASMGVPVDEELRSGFLRYMASRRNPDGGWGLHTESPSYLFSTVLTHVALRMLGARPDDPLVRSSRGWIREHGGATGIPMWGKLFLATLNLYHYDGVPPLSPELWLLPRAAPLHPGRIWCHARVVLLAMSHLYGRRFRIPSTPLIRSIRSEIYTSPYEGIAWRRQREHVSSTDVYVDQPGLSRAANLVLGAYERIPGLRRRALAETLDHIHHEDETTDHIDIGPVNKLLNMMVAWFEEGPESIWFASHAGHIPDYLWETQSGVHVNGYNSTALWDTAFAVQALVAAPGAEALLPVLARAHDFIEASQVLEDVPDHERYYRHRSRGGWPFSNRPHGWPISDCTAEGLKAALALQGRVQDPLPYERLRDAVELILSLQNTTGGWATYELTRGSSILEKLNSSALFSGIMVDYDYPECTSSCLQGLAAFRRRYPTRLAPQVELAISRGREYLLSSQRQDGSWYGSWGVCFTYGTWFGTWGLLASGLGPETPALGRAVRFLLSHQNPDGGWGEHWTSCTEQRYVASSESQVVMTSWALLALLACRCSSPAVERGLAFLRQRQLPSGDWPREPIEGVFNRTCMIHYDNYRNYFPIWALGLGSGRSASS